MKDFSELDADQQAKYNRFINDLVTGYIYTLEKETADINTVINLCQKCIAYTLEQSKYTDLKASLKANPQLEIIPAEANAEQLKALADFVKEYTEHNGNLPAVYINAKIANLVALHYKDNTNSFRTSLELVEYCEKYNLDFLLE